MRQRSLPPLTVVVRRPDGTRRTVTVNGLTSADRVADLASAVGLSPADRETSGAAREGRGDDGLFVDGRHCAGHLRLTASGVRHGSVLGLTGGERTVPGRPVAWLEWIAGPDAGRRVGLPAGRHLVGRRRGLPLEAMDERLAAHHGIVEVDAAGAVHWHPLAGRTESACDEVAAGGADAGPGAPLRGGALLRLGSGILAVAEAPAAIDVGRSQRPIDGWVEPLVRSPRRLPPAAVTAVDLPSRDTAEVDVPAGGSGLGTVTAAIISLVGGVVMVLVLHQILMLVMGGVAAAGALATWAVQVVRRRRSSRAARRATAARLAETEARLSKARRHELDRLRSTPGLADAAAAARSGVGLWERRPGHGDAFTATIGIGGADWWPALVAPGGVDPLAESMLERFARLEDVPMVISLEPGAVVGIVGPRPLALATARSLVAQLAAACGPADLTLAVVVPPRRRPDWEWADWLPHTRGIDGAALVGEAADQWMLTRVTSVAAATPSSVLTGDASVAAGGSMAVVVVDDPQQLANRTSPVRRLLGQGTTAAAIVLVEELRELPSACTEAFEIAADASALRHRWGGGSPLAQRLRVCGASPETASQIARSMARFDDPERVDDLGSLPTEVALADLLGECVAGPGVIAAAWDEAGPDAPPRAVIGVAADGVVEIDLERDGPHTLIGGTTGAGKSELLRTLVASLAVASPPEALSFVLVDYKGGAAFDACAALPHVVGVVTDLDGRLAARVLTSLEAELHRRETLLRSVGAGDLRAYRAVRGADHEQLARLVVVVDEFAALAVELPTFLAALVSIAQRGRSLGVHLVLATQRPHGVVNDDIRANTNLRISLRVQDRTDALDIVGDPLPATLSRTRPGSAVIRLDATEVAAFQTARCTGLDADDQDGRSGRRTSLGGPLRGRDQEASPVVASVVPDAMNFSPAPDTHLARPVTQRRTALDVLVDRLVAAARGRRLPRRPWLDPLPSQIEAPAGPSSDGVGIRFGERDLIAQQERDGLSWEPRNGHLVLAGSVGAGVSSTLGRVAFDLCAAHAPSALHLYAIDASGAGGLAALDGLAHCAGVVAAGDPARRSRLLRRLGEEVAHRRTDLASDDPLIVVLVDGYGSLAASLETPAAMADADLLDTLVLDGPRVGVVLAAGFDRPADVPTALSARASSRLLFGLADPAEASIWGVAARDALPLGRPGRCIQLESGHEAHVYAPLDPAATLAAINARWNGDEGAGPSRLADMPSTVLLADVLAARPDAASPLDASGESAFGETSPTAAMSSARLPIGLSVSTIDPAWVTLHDGEHLLVAGPARSGRSTALATIVEGWRAVAPDGWLGVVRARRNGAGIPGADREGTLTEVVRAAAAAGGDRLIVVDDADLIADDGGLVAMLAEPDHASVKVVAAGRPDALRSVYGHWTGVVRRSRKGLLLGPVHDLDADVLGVILPRHRPAVVPAGRGWLVTDGVVDAIQVARPSRPDLRRAA